MKRRPDPVASEVFRHLFISVAEEMGVVLERTGFSPNIKERRDHSCAIFDAAGRLVAQAAHIPVHLGAFPLMMQAIVPRFRWRSGDVVICNDPFVGGTHLPDISVISPVFGASGRRLGFVANRAHHADIGGTYPGSMGPTTEVFQEGVILPPSLLRDRGRMNDSLVELFLRNVRTPDERRGDLAAQLGANATGVRRFAEIAAAYGEPEVRDRVREAHRHTANSVRRLIGEFPSGEHRATDWLDDDGHGSGPLPICVSLGRKRGRLQVNWAGTAAQQRGSINATLAVTHSAVLYVLFCLLPDGVALNHGALSAVDIEAPPGSLANARPPAAVAAGNVETSQRMVDALLRALAAALPGRVPAASQGTMNNLTLGGVDPATGRLWAYYETTGGGAGADADNDGISAVHCHMSNTRNTPAEALEYHYPLRVRRSALRDESGGAGLHSGGCGTVREVEFLAPATATFLTDRRDRGPYGLAGGDPGAAGANWIGSPGQWVTAPAKGTRHMEAGERIRIETPGGGGWGTPAAAVRRALPAERRTRG